MKILLFVLLILNVFSVAAQDLLISKSGDTTKAVVLAVYFDNIQYRKFDNPNGPVLTISKYELSEIRYMNGSTDDFTKFSKPATNDTVETTIGLDSSQIYYALGSKDAFRYYKGYKSAATATFITSVLASPLGLGMAAITTMDKPTENLGFPDETLKLNPNYHKGYITAAKKRKSKRVWTNWLYGSMITLVSITITINVSD